MSPEIPTAQPPAPAPQLPRLQYRGLQRSAKIPACVVSLDDLRRLYTNLNEKTREALDRHLETTPRRADISDEQFEQLKVQAREVGGLTVSVNGSGGEQVLATTATALAQASLPEQITSITFDSATALQAFNVTPLNRFRVHLDFTEPPGFNAYNPWDQPTPNGSQLEIIGSDETWVTGVYESTLTFFRQRRQHRSWLHGHITFNLLNYLLGFPAALWIIFRLDSTAPLSFQAIHGALRGALYVYLFLLALLIFRLIIGGFRWIFPLIEIEGARSKKARGLLGSVLGTLLLALLYDVLRTLLWS